MYSKNQIIDLFKLSNKQVYKLDKFIEEIKHFNIHTNIVGKSTLIDPWRRHILDSLQIANFIKSNKSTIIDMGTGAGIPGIILSIINYNNVSLVDSNTKKIRFINNLLPKLNIRVRIYLQSLESLKNKKFDFLISRALANLNKLFFYSQNFLKHDSVLIFLKGKNVKNEIKIAQEKWQFNYKNYNSLSDEQGNVLIIDNLKIRND